MNRSAAAALAAFLVGGVWGCEGAPERALSTSSMRDSAGVTIVENSAPAWGPDLAWTLSQEPARRIGSMSGDPDTQLFRVADAHMFDDGHVAVVNAGTSDIRFFDHEGRLQATSGRDGEGPGEYQFPTQLYVSGDSVFVYDRGLARISVLSASGVYARSFLMPEIDDRPPSRPLGLLSDRSIVANSPYDFGPETVRGFQRADDALVRVSPADGTVRSRVGVFPGHESYLAEGAGGLGSQAIPFSRQSMIAVSAAGFYFGANNLYELDQYTSEGQLVRRIRIDRPVRPATEADLDAFIANLTERAPNEEVAQRLDRHYRQMPLPELMPVFSSVLVDAVGNLWVEEYSGLMFGPSTWSVFDEEGIWLGAVGMPDRFEPYQIGADFVLGRYEDVLDVEYLYVYDLRKP